MKSPVTNPRNVARSVQTPTSRFRFHDPCAIHSFVSRFHVHLVSDSTGETLDSVVKAVLAQFDSADAVKHTWPLVRSQGHLDRVIDEIARRPGPVLFTLVGTEMRARLERRCAALGLPAVAPLDAVTATFSRVLGQAAHGTPGRQHALDEAYFARVEAIQFTMAHDDGLGQEDWEQAEIVLAGVSRSSKTPTAIYLANRGYKTANIPLVPESPPPARLFQLERPLVVGLTVSGERLAQVRRNRLITMGNIGDSPYVDPARIAAELAFARRLFADKGWPVIDVTRRSIEETAAAVIELAQAHEETLG